MKKNQKVMDAIMLTLIGVFALSAIVLCVCIGLDAKVVGTWALYSMTFGFLGLCILMAIDI